MGVRGPWDFDLECRFGWLFAPDWPIPSFYSIPSMPPGTCTPLLLPHTPAPAPPSLCMPLSSKRNDYSFLARQARRRVKSGDAGCGNRPEESDQKYRRPQESRFHLSQSAFGISGQLAARTRLVVGLGWLAASVLMDLRRRSTNLMAAWRFLWVTDSHPLLFVCVRARDAA